MSQDITNNSQIEKQLNVSENHGNIYLSKQSRLSARFERLREEVASDIRYEGVKEALEYYLTKLDGVDLITKLNDGGFTQREVIKASRRKEKYWKQLEKNLFFESAQLIDSELFAKIIIEFETHVETPLINQDAPKSEIVLAVLEKVINPIMGLLNNEGQDDSFLNYTVEDIYGMLYYLTGKCHINWKNYDSL